MLKNSKKVVFAVVVAAVLFGIFLNYPVFAENSRDIVETNLFGNIKDDGTGCGVFTVLNLVVDILSMGVGVLGVIGIVLVGIQYLTAKGNVDQVERSKKRLYAIIIGIAVYALLYSGVQWLMPGGKLNTGQKCATVSDEKLAKMKADEEAERKRLEEEKKNNTGKGTSTGSNSGSNAGSSASSKKGTPNYKKAKSYEKCMKYAAKVVIDKGYCKITNPAERISKVARLLAGSYYKANQYYKSAMLEIGSLGYGGSAAQQKGNSCDVFVHTVLRASGVDPNVPNNRQGSNTATLYDYFGKHPEKWEKVKFSKRTEGDVTVKPLENGKMGHTSLVIRNKAGKLVTAEASNPGNGEERGYPVVKKQLNSGSLYSVSVWHYIGD